MDTKRHYDMLIDENNDPFRDAPVLQSYMDKWDGKAFIDALNLDGTKNVLEIGMGTGRLAARVAPMCKSLTGIDLSPKTVERAKENLKEFGNIIYICDDFLQYKFSEAYDVIYCSLTSMHFEDKNKFLQSVSSILNINGTFCISLDKNRSEYIDMGTRKLRIYPDNAESITEIAAKYNMTVSKSFETEFADIVLFTKGENK